MSLLGAVWPVLSVVVVAVIGWLVTEFLARPVRDFFNIRREVKRRMLLHWDIPSLHTLNPHDRAEAYKEMQEPIGAFAELGAQLVSFAKSETAAAWVVRKLGFDPGLAGKVLR